MSDTDSSLPPVSALSAWLVDRGLDGTAREDLLTGYCEKLVSFGLPLMRLHVAQRALHPRFGGIGFDWLRDGGNISLERYAHGVEPPVPWLKSPLYHLLKSGEMEFRAHLDDAVDEDRFPILRDLKEQGGTDYFATGLFFEKPPASNYVDPDNTKQGMLASYTTDAPQGFSEQDLSLIRCTLPPLGLALKATANRRMAQDLLQVYLGRDAGQRVLSGEIQRGSVEELDAVVCLFDLSGFTSLAEQIPGPEMIAMLNAYHGLAVTAIQERGGNVLKFMGDGLLAMFDHPDPRDAACAALDMVTVLSDRVARANRNRERDGLPVARCTFALHAGQLYYGNIGGEDRLDFTVIGPAVNLTARVAEMHRALGRRVILTEPVFDVARAGKHDLVSLGRYVLRGISKPQELYTIWPDGGV
ncbi:adenylate/guanylate cyclase domain-containing protein [Pseudodonghicola flavimaris]|uniref:Adenylate/guanylate cyclase domain-containing protein n=1 Tax=Pseudodonghicola flavimaris TaxID=3050036 RepID=A0ABT7F6P9_9RHOB|nr:adenylate/guanylate cyclase domain-containing protein [Pseudodonghicola flavimaris]MDK3020284.1 adenylate/guanylate cyclase domain-containing protein [Pseudodonghicola flavimaris]